MKNKDLTNQIPVLKFLDRYKSVILVPIVLSTLYFVLPLSIFRDGSRSAASDVTQSILKERFSAVFNGEVAGSDNPVVDMQSLAEIRSLQRQMRSDSFLTELILKTNLFESERKRGDSLEKLAQSLGQWVAASASIADSGRINFSYILLLSNADKEKIKLVETYVANRFSNSSSVNVSRIVREPYVPKYSTAGSLRSSFRMGLLLLLFGKTAFGLFLGALLSISLIVMLESPNLFYSQRIHEEVFNPIRSDRQLEKAEVEVDSGFSERLYIDMRFAIAFLTAMFQRNPIFELFRNVFRFAK